MTAAACLLFGVAVGLLVRAGREQAAYERGLWEGRRAERARRCRGNR